MRQEFREKAEEHQVLRRDAMNLVNLHVRRWVELADPESFPFPPLDNVSLWLRAYKLVSAGSMEEKEVNATI
ncbi:hypothetical protein EC973_003890 [Apophysomyces ossiformis]|uniref:Uncharacterized protein n=1 Tax=Apophysomyces ossiformis TaxID=679940 RepID=A0A8H7BIZ2_9FUNG|nr:hypothetical protein EC973_003890 [Apophysomyces ossiformis]